MTRNYYGTHKASCQEEIFNLAANLSEKLAKLLVRPTTIHVGEHHHCGIHLVKVVENFLLSLKTVGDVPKVVAHRADGGAPKLGWILVVGDHKLVGTVPSARPGGRGTAETDAGKLKAILQAAEVTGRERAIKQLHAEMLEELFVVVRTEQVRQVVRLIPVEAIHVHVLELIPKKRREANDTVLNADG